MYRGFHEYQIRILIEVGVVLERRVVYTPVILNKDYKKETQETETEKQLIPKENRSSCAKWQQHEYRFWLVRTSRAVLLERLTD